jgi:hypothetical protein
MARIVVCGYMVRHPVMGNLLAYFHYLLGLSRLGHEVLYLEESGWPKACFDFARNRHTDDPNYGLEVLQQMLSRFGLDIPVCYVNRDSGQLWRTYKVDLKQALDAADLLLNIGGVCWLPEFLRCERRVLIDMDPFFTQIGHFADEGLGQYQVHFSYGVNIGHPACSIPVGGIKWQATVPPVVPEIWQNLRPSTSQSSLTTIANWRAYGRVSYQGHYYGQKSQEFRRVLALPQHTAQPLELALSGADKPTKRRLRAAGWQVLEGLEVSRDLATYQAYIASSRGEFSVAKQAYVKTHSGWFSDRSVCYLAAGRPVILQDTGFSEWLPTGSGVLTFSSLEQAVQRIEQLNANYQAHCCAAQQIAEQFFSYQKVLPRIVETGLRG